MYVFIVIALMLALPLISIVAQLILADHSALQGVSNLAVVAKWYVFWAVGVRLGLAGLRQIIQPRYTAETILGLKGPDSLFFVRELGFANSAMGSIGAASLLAPNWVTPAAMLGAIYYGLAGINHCFHKGRNQLQNVALVSDLFAASVLAICCFA
jgi:predicted DNA repair protein MutK